MTIKLAQVITRMDWGGSPDILRIICQNLGPEYRVTLITGKLQNLRPKTKKFLEGFVDNLIIVPELQRNINPFWDFLAFVKLYRIFKKEKFDIIQTNTAKAGFLGRIAGRLAGPSKIIYMSHGHVFYGYFNPFMNWFIVLLEKFAGMFTDKIIALTELEKRDFVRFRVKPAKDIEVIPSGLELEGFPEFDDRFKSDKKARLGLPADKLLVGLIARLEPVKGPGYFIEALPAIIERFSDVYFIVVGEGSLRQQLEDRVQELGLQGELRFLGWRDDVLEITSLLDVLVQPSLNEAVGRNLLEAQLLGVPVVATKVGGIPEVVKNGETGILEPSKDKDALSLAVYGLLENEERRKDMSQKARGWVRDRFSSQKMVERVEEIYGKLVNIDPSLRSG